MGDLLATKENRDEWFSRKHWNYDENRQEPSHQAHAPRNGGIRVTQAEDDARIGVGAVQANSNEDNPQSSTVLKVTITVSLSEGIDALWSRWSNKQRSLAPKLPALHPNPSALIPTGRTTQYQHPNAGTVENQPALSAKNPSGVYVVPLATAVEAIDWTDLVRIQEFFANLNLKYGQVGE
ncbi:hypothetical protein AYO20_11396 [Fonsecaea nubica]|uniref:Uncharacterized protein n=1 Tax=Fonsecaea nubica TaxID=856822 RepID=A0A178BUH9_9EURO|nr:hypothetical protein AYO20_11396 [Fonsecaea nubica]OAL21278.1 hypothetical protein AYO20_11396 [Fonsecaea nubica]